MPLREDLIANVKTLKRKVAHLERLFDALLVRITGLEDEVFPVSSSTISAPEAPDSLESSVSTLDAPSTASIPDLPPNGLPFLVASPLPNSEVRDVGVSGIMSLAGHDITVSPGTVIQGTPRGLNVENDEDSDRVFSYYFTAIGCTGYGAYLAHARDHYHHHLQLRQIAGANMALFRLGGGDRVIINQFDFDNWAALNDSIRVYGCRNFAALNGVIKGGHIRVGVQHGDMGGATFPATNQWYRNIQFHYRGSPMPAAFSSHEFVESLTIENVHVIGGQRFLDMDQEYHPAVTIKGCTHNGVPVTRAMVGDSNKQGSNLQVLP